MPKRKLLLAALFVVSVLSCRCATAQLGIYGEFNATHDPSNSAWYRGFTGGLYDNFLHAGPVRIGLDLRGAYATGDQYGYRSFAVGPRLEIKPPLLPIKPYVQACVGFGGSEYNGTSRLQTHYDNKLQYGAIAGVDYTLLPYIDLRLAEVEYVRMSGVSGPALNLVTVGAGIVVRLP